MNELEPLGIFLQEFLKNIPAKNKSDKFASARKFIIEERQRIIQAIRVTTYSFNGDKNRIIAYVENMQTDITRLSDDYFQILQSQNKESVSAVSHEAAINDLLAFLLSELNHVYDHLKENFKPYFNEQLKVQEALKESHISSINRMAGKIISVITENQVDEKLAGLLEDYLYALSRPAHHKIHTGRELDYHLNFVSALYKLANENTGEYFTLKLYRELVYLNFNHLPLIWYYLNGIQKDYDHVDHYKEELVDTILNFRNLQQMPVKSGCAYDTEAASLKVILSSALAEEITCLKRLHRLQSKVTYKNWPARLFTPFYFHVSFTLDQLVFFFRLLIETGIVITEKKVDLFDFISKHIGTSNKKNLSVKSIGNKFADPKYPAAQKVKSALLEMVRLINEKYPA